MEGDEEMGLFGRKKVIEDEEEKTEIDIYRLAEAQVTSTYVTTIVKQIYNDIKNDVNIKEEDKSMVFEEAIRVLCELLKQ